MPDSSPHFDPSNFKTEPYVRRIEKPWGYELHFVPIDMPYMGKLIHIKAGARLSLQVHDQKTESWLLINGQAACEWENHNGQLVKTELQPSRGYNLSIGQKHRLIGLSDCDIIEVSTPEKGTTWRLEDDYSRPNETPEQRALERS
jgi:mannose-6-phosphate isomerase-like protein (cupin superfamily)